MSGFIIDLTLGRSRPLRVVCTAMLLAALVSGCATAPQKNAEAKENAAQVKKEFLHAWYGYERYAWGHDALRPLSRTAHDWYGEPLLMTPVDALDTLILLGCQQEADKARKLIATRLSFDRDIYVKNFEVTIRLLGGLLSSYQLTGDARLLRLAQDLGRRLLPAFNSPTGLPYAYVNLRTGKVRNPITNPAETGTLLLEFGTLSKLTGNPIYYQKAKRSLVETFRRRSPLGLVGASINVETGQWLDLDSHISGGIDSYYEYLWKCWLLFGDKDCLAMWRATIPAINRYLADDVNETLWYGHANMQSGARTETTYGALDAFFPALLALSGDVHRARRLQASSFRMWNLHRIEPEVLDYRTMKVVAGSYHLRPEIIESSYYLEHFTHDPAYLHVDAQMFQDFVRYCRTDTGYAALSDVVAKKKRDEMESFVFAETFKYFYLLFAPEDTLPFAKIVFNTEAHPLRRTW
jgi:mannosidase alpha-like ER degradation enhancer 2